MIKKFKNSKAFTLIELIVVVGVIGILVLIASSSFSNQTEKAKHNAALADMKIVADATDMYNIDSNDWPRLTDEHYTAEELEAYSESFYDATGKKANLDSEGKYYDIDYDKLNQYAKAPVNKENYILQNPAGKVFYMDNLTAEGKSRVDYSQPKEDEGVPPSEPVDFAYTGDVQEFVVPATGRYKLEVWGAAGGKGRDNNGSVGQEKGLGGFSEGVIELDKDTNIYVYVGGEGRDGNTSSLIKGGFNGGGDSPSSSNSTRSEGGAGGGATDVRLHDKSLYSRVIVAGGAGGAGYPHSNITAGYGGGATGGSGYESAGAISTGGGQLNGGNSSGSYGGSFGQAGVFGIGGSGGYKYTSAGGAGGGGGWYGGAGGQSGNNNGLTSGGGGSGYVHTADSYKPADWKLTEDHYLTETELIAGNQTMPDPNGGTMVGNTGHGFARITYIGK